MIIEIPVTKRFIPTMGLVAAILFSANTSFASEQSRFWLQGDVSAGYQRIEPDLNSEIPKDGQLLGGRILGEYRHRSFGAFGLGVGIQQTWQEGETETRIQEYVLRSLVVDGSYLYPIGSKVVWLGWLLRSQTGKGGRFEFSDIESVQTLLTTGPQLRLNFEAKRWDWVVGVSALAAVNSPSRKIFNVPVYVGLSIPLSQEYQAPEPPKPTPMPVAKVEPRATPPVAQEQIAVEFNASLITFDLNKAILKPESKAFLVELSGILKEQSDNWQSIVISGHTDISGLATRNKELSQERAEAVMNWLIQQGVPANRLSAVGYGPEKLLPGIPANSKDHRRVELLFKGVLDGVKINDAMSALKSQN